MKSINSIFNHTVNREHFISTCSPFAQSIWHTNVFLNMEFCIEMACLSKGRGCQKVQKLTTGLRSTNSKLPRAWTYTVSVCYIGYTNNKYVSVYYTNDKELGAVNSKTVGGWGEGGGILTPVYMISNPHTLISRANSTH